MTCDLWIGDNVKEVAERMDDANEQMGRPGEAVTEEVGRGEMPGGLSGEQLARLRATLVAAHPDAVPELIAGGDFDALLASVPVARAAYARIRETTTREAAASVPRGGGTRAPDPAAYADLSPEAKIAAGVRSRAVGQSGGRAVGSA
ncbi:MAG: hypothetical protein ACTHMR_17415 [Thermomicrobiales bacterium]